MHNPLTGVVIIGRNEGDRLVRCLQSVQRLKDFVVYVDSQSSDGSPERAEAMGANVVRLSLDVPFTAGRARNAGFNRLMELHSNLHFVQFIDGDCEVADGWIEFAVQFLVAHPEVAIVCGRRKERFPTRSIYNQLCDIEWDTPIGDAQACGGDFLVRTEVFREAGGFNNSLIAGEEPELCYRLRQQDWRIHRIDMPMTYHDAAMVRIGQWLRRSARCGYAYAARAALHWRDGNRYCWRENARIVLWALLLPTTIAVLSAMITPWFLVMALVLPIQFVRIVRYISAKRPGIPTLAYSFFTVLGKWPEFYGQMLFVVRWLRGREQRIIEYK